MNINFNTNCLKDGAYFCYCAYDLLILRYSGFLWVVPTNTGIFLCGESTEKAEKAELSMSSRIVFIDNLGLPSKKRRLYIVMYFKAF